MVCLKADKVFGDEGKQNDYSEKEYARYRLPAKQPRSAKTGSVPAISEPIGPSTGGNSIEL